MAIDGISGANAASALNGSRNTIADNFDTFLTLLTTQLRNQNPLDPLDTNQFTSQMVQFTSVEQQLKTNEFLEALVLSNLSQTYTGAVGFVGKHITAQGSAAQLVNGSATWNYSINQPSEDVTFTVTDQNGNVVHTANTSVEAGDGQISWDGFDSTGARMPDGTYTITIDARTDGGAYIPVSTQMEGVVTAVDLSGVEPVLIVNGGRINLSSVESVSVAS